MLSGLGGAQSFPGIMLFAALQTPLFAQLHLLTINQWDCIASNSTVEA